jgi:hypothetical protein
VGSIYEDLMKLWPNKIDYYLPTDCEHILTVGLVGDPFSYAIQIILWVDILKLSEKEPDLIGRPTYLAYYQGTFRVWPTPDKKYELRIRYQPHIKEI